MSSLSPFRALSFSSSALRPNSPTPTWMLMRAPTSRAALNCASVASRRAAKGRQIERDELVVAGEILLAQPRDVAGIFGGCDLHDPAGLVLAGAVGEHRAHAGVLQSLDAGVGVRGRILDVRPVEHAGHAGVDRAKRADVVGGVDVVRRHLGAEGALHDVAVVLQRAVGQHVAQKALPHMPVGVDEARHDDACSTASITCAFGALMFGLHRRDFLAFDQHVGLLEVADGAGRARARSRP